jgi:polyhydroxyalkanoate synthesis regulator phasin
MIKSLIRVTLALSLVALMAGVSIAQQQQRPQQQQMNPIQARLQAAVEAGEITRGEQRAMLQALGESSRNKKETVGRRLREAVAAGEVSTEEARAMYDAYSNAGQRPQRTESDRPQRGGNNDNRAERGERGDKSPQVKRERLQRAEGDKQGVRGDMRAKMTAIRAAVEAGELTREQARAKIEAMRGERGEKPARAKRGERKEAKITCENCDAQKQLR